MALWHGWPPLQTPLQSNCRAICSGLLRALAFCHGRGVAHGSLGPGSILLSTFEDRRARELLVKLDNFGFARMHKPAGQSACTYPLKALAACNPETSYIMYLWALVYAMPASAEAGNG